MFVAKGLNSITVDNTYSSSEANTLSISGSARYKLPIMRVNIPSGQSVQKLNVANGANLKKVILNVNGTLTGTGLDFNEYLVENNTSLTPSISGNGTVNGRLIQEFDFPIGTYVHITGMRGGVGGANGGDLKYQNPSIADGNPTTAFSSGNGSMVIGRNSATSWSCYWTETRCDYRPFSTANGTSSGTAGINNFFNQWLDGSGDFDRTNTGTYVSKIVPHANGRDIRTIIMGTVVKDNKRYVWFGTNNKFLNFEHAGNAGYDPPRFAMTGYTGFHQTLYYSIAHNNAIGLTDTQNGAPVSTSYDDTNFNGTINGDPNL